MAAKSGQLKVKDQPFEIQSNSKYSIILGKRIKSVKIAHRHMLTCSFADDQEGLGGWKCEVHLWYFSHLFYTSGDSLSYTWRVWRHISKGALESQPVHEFDVLMVYMNHGFAHVHELCVQRVFPSHSSCSGGSSKAISRHFLPHSQLPLKALKVWGLYDFVDFLWYY